MKAHETRIAERFALLLGPAKYVEFLDALQLAIDVGVMKRDSDDVWSIFCWDDSPQGHDFWYQYGKLQDGREF